MEKQYKTFEDLVFEDYIKNPIEREAAKRIHNIDMLTAKIAQLKFPNGYMISVLLGACFYSNGVNTYEVAAFNKDEGLYYGPPFDDDVAGYKTEEEVTEIMKQVQDL